MSYQLEIQELTTSVWDSILHMPVEPTEDAPRGDRTISACVHISGSWHGALSLSCRAELAAEAAAVMFGLETERTNIGDIQDALGELVNMIGGNVKALLPGTCKLSVPSVAEGADYEMAFPDSKVVAKVPMRCGKHLLSVSLVQAKAA